MTRNIIVCLDFSDSDQKILDRVAEWNAINDKIWFIHAAAPAPDFVGLEVGPQHIRDQRADQLRELHKKLDGVKDRFLKDGFTAEALLLQGPTVDTVIEKAKDLDATLFVVGKHHRGLWKEMFEGDTAKTLIDKSPIPVLVIPEGA